MTAALFETLRRAAAAARAALGGRSARRAGPWLVAALALCAAARPARGDLLKSSPGELTRSHAALDAQGQCEACHDGDKATPAAKCLGCHDHQDLKREIDAGRGFHASTKARGRDCKVCHQEHRGRGFDLMGWRAIGGEQAFDHGLTGWPLQGKHQTKGCDACHKKVNQQGLRTYAGADKTCGGCHAKESPHGALRPVLQRCDRCHNETGWRLRKARFDFDHDDKGQAAMPLEGAHADVNCAKCHPKAAFKLPRYAPGECESCHPSPHGGQLFSTRPCGACHAPTLRTLKEVRFDHKKEARFALVGKHGDAACGACHTAALGKKKPATSCESCHARDNRHGGKIFAKFGSPPACATCHTAREWRRGLQFNHATGTAFALTGKHARLACRQCHRGGSPSEFEEFHISDGCMSCHQHKKAHGGQYKQDQCLTCHEEGGSKKMKKEALENFHGEGSRFPLHDGHAKVACAMCHLNDVYQATPTGCGDCHQDALHRGTLGKDCARCHEGGKWDASRFDHAEDTTWPLRGKHAQVTACASCHPGRAYDGTPTTCGAAGCHQRDDVHEGALGARCETCHDVEGQLLFRHNRDAAFKLDGAHAPLVCGACHTSVAFKPARTDCYGCHPEPKVHAGRYGTQCARCHSTTSFRERTAALHDVGDFSLEGAHDQVACARCHKDRESLRGAGGLCITCHKQDDVHQNALSPRCGECHTQRSFAPARFDHLAVGCSLNGQHATLPCADCHQNGNFGAVSPLCVSCHRADARRVRTQDHTALLDCGRCHGAQAWLPVALGGGQSICR